jgi:prepilin-type processing-associated H-X9-DG protein
MPKRDKSKKLGPVEVLVLVFACLFVLVIFKPAAKKLQLYAHRIQCSDNLSQIGKAMLIYANDYDGVLPRSGGRNTLWASTVPNWKANNRFSAYGIPVNGYGGQASISSCFYLLVKYMNAAPKTFVCPSDAGTTEFKLADVDAGNRELIDLWDFGPEARKHCSYAYHMPFGLYALTTSSHPGMAVAADRNPWIDSLASAAKEMMLFNPKGGRDAVKSGNAIAHNHEGQNVLFLDGHVAFEDHSFCGVQNDNIYTFWDGGDIRFGAKPTYIYGSQPQDRFDSLLVHDPAPPRGKKISKEPEAINSSDLEQTSIVATIDCPMPEHKNVIWCSTFQMTWDKLKNDIIGEPVKVPQAAELASRLNQAEFSQGNLESESFYASVGIVKEGIIEQIQKEMKKRFPFEPVPIFNELDVLPAYDRANSIVSYSFLKTDIGFRYPFYTREDAFAFEDSNGQRTNVTSFCADTKATDPNEVLVREQVDILYYRYADQESSAEYAVDLCRHTSPYQVVLALVPRKDNLSEIVAAVEQKISEFSQDPNYENLCKLRPASGNRPADRLVVPDVLYILTHHFAELEGRVLGNEGWSTYRIFEAMQVIDFALSRTGVVLKSEARIIAPPFSVRPRRLEEPRHFYFNKPFLIYVKKRGPDYSPFFVMWVDNAELMSKF